MVIEKRDITAETVLVADMESGGRHSLRTGRGRPRRAATVRAEPRPPVPRRNRQGADGTKRNRYLTVAPPHPALPQLTYIETDGD